MPHDGVKVAVASNTIQSLGANLISIFIPVYLLELFEKTMGFREAMVWVIVFYVGYYLSFLLWQVPVGHWVRRAGYHTSILLGNLAFALWLMMILLARENIWWVWAAMAATGLMMFYWIPYHCLFALDGKVGHGAGQVSWANILMRGSAVLGPVIGGVLIVEFGFQLVYIIGIATILASSLAVLRMQHHSHDDDRFSWSDLEAEISKDEVRDQLVRYTARDWERTIQSLFWPVVVFLIMGTSYEKLGVLISAGLGLSLVVIYRVGKFTDRDGAGRWYRAGVMGSVVSWGMRALAVSGWGVLAADVVSKVSSPFYWVPLESETYAMLRRGPSLTRVVLRGLAVNTVRVLGMVGFLAWWVAFGNFWYIFWVAGLWNLAALYNWSGLKDR